MRYIAIRHRAPLSKPDSARSDKRSGVQPVSIALEEFLPRRNMLPHLDVIISEMLRNARLAEINAYAQEKIDQISRILLTSYRLPGHDLPCL